MIVQCQDVGFSYGSRRVVDHVSASWSAGVTGLVGVNGAGKTTLMRLVVGLLSPDEGRVVLAGRSGSGREARRELQRSVGYVPQDPSWVGSFTVDDLVAYFAFLRGVPRGRRAGQVATAIDAVGLTEQKDTKLSRLSGGMRRRALVAQAMVHEPRLLVLDEPTAGLDPEQRVALRQVLRTLGESTAVLLSTHLVEDVTQTAGRVDVMDSGRLVWSGSVDQLIALDDPDDPDLRRLGDTPAERGLAQARRTCAAPAP